MERLFFFMVVSKLRERALSALFLFFVHSLELLKLHNFLECGLLPPKRGNKIFDRLSLYVVRVRVQNLFFF